MTQEVIVPTELPDPIDPPLDVVVEVAFGADPDGNPLEWTWVNVTDDVKLIDGVGSRRGRSDETRPVTPSNLTLVLESDDGRYTPDNPRSPYYGQIIQGTPVRVRPIPGEASELVTLADTFSRTMVGQWGVPDVGLKWGALPIDTNVYVNGSRGVVETDDDGSGLGGTAGILNSTQFFDGTITMKVGMSDVMDTSSMLAGYAYRWLGYYLVMLLFEPSGDVSLQWYDELGNNLLLNISDLHTYTAGDEFWIKTRTDGDRHRIKTWKVGDPEPIGWDIDEINNGSPPPGTTGPFTGFGGGFVEGWVLAFVARLGPNLGNEAVTFDDVTVVSRDTPLFFGHIYEWHPTWPEGDISTEYDEGYSRVSVTASGPLRRILADNSSGLRSPMHRAVLAYNDDPDGVPVRAYWPMEESGFTITEFASPFTGVQPLQASPEFTPGQGDMSTIPGSAPVPLFGPGAVYRAEVPIGDYPHGWVVNSLFYMEDQVEGAGVGARTVLRVQAADSDVSNWRIRLLSGGGIRLEARDSDWSIIDTSDTTLDNDAFYGRWMLVSLRVSLDGSDLAGQFTIYAAETLTENVPTEEVATVEADFVASASSAGRPAQVKVVNLAQTVTDRNWGHIIVGAIASDFSPDGRILFDPNALSAYNGEPALERVARLAREEGVSTGFIITESGGQSERMGPQEIGATLIENFNECEEADGGVIFESRRHSGLVWRGGSSLYNQSPKLILNAQSGHVINPLRPVLDDQRLRNDVTAERIDGSSSRVIDEAHVLKFGRYRRSDLRVNVFSDQQLPDLAAWAVHVGTQHQMRYPTVTPYLSGYVHRQPPWLLLEIGDLVRLVDLPPQHPPDEVDLLVQGTNDRLTPETWSAGLNAIPAAAWTNLMGFVNGTPGAGLCISGRAGDYVSTPSTGETTLTVAEDFEDDSLNITTTDGPGSPDWARTMDEAHTGSWSFGVGPVGAGITTDVDVDVPPGVTYLVFWWWNSAAGRDFEVLLDGDLVLSGSASSTWTEGRIYVAGGTTLTFRHVEPAGMVGGTGESFIDDLQFFTITPGPLEIDGDLEIAFDATLPSWVILDSDHTNRRRIGPYKWVDGSDQSYGLDVTAGFPRLIWSEDGSSLMQVIGRVAVPVVGGERAAIKSTLDVDNGSSEHVVKFYYAPSMYAVQGMLLKDNGLASAPDAPHFNVGPNIDIRAEIITDRRTGELFEVVNQDGDPGNRGWRLQVETGGTIRFEWSPDGTNVLGVDSPVPLPGADSGAVLPVGGRMAIRVALVGDHNDDGTLLALSFYFADSIAGPWIQIRQILLFSDPFSGGPTQIFNTTAPVLVGSPEGTSPEFSVAKVEIYDDIAYPYPTPGPDDPILPLGELIASPDFRNLMPGTTSFTDAQGNPWTLSGDAEISPWVLTDEQILDGTTQIAITDAPLEMGNINDGTAGNTAPDDKPTPMVIHSGYVKNGINGPTVADPNFEDLPPGTRVFTDDAGRQWTLNSDETVICPGASMEC